MLKRHTYRVRPFTPANAPKAIAVWYEDYPLTIELVSGKQGFTFEGKNITVYYSESSPIGVFHRLMTQVVEHISHLLELEAVYLAPPEERKYKPQPYNSIGWEGADPEDEGGWCLMEWQGISIPPSMGNAPEAQDDEDEDDEPTARYQASKTIRMIVIPNSKIVEADQLEADAKQRIADGEDESAVQRDLLKNLEKLDD